MSDANTPPSDPTEPKGERIAKALSRAGIASRRDAERMIEAGRVSVNGRTLKKPAFLVTPDDVIAVDGTEIAAKPPTRLWRYHKPDGLVTTHKDDQGRKTVFESLPPGLPRVVSVGRLDLNSEGLLLLTNDGELSRMLELPSTAWTRRYRVRAYGRADEARFRQLKRGVEVDGVRYGSIDVKLERQQGANVWLIVTLQEGKNREVRRVLESVGLAVNRLIRISYGPFQLGNLQPGDAQEVPRKVLKEQLPREARGNIA